MKNQDFNKAIKKAKKEVKSWPKWLQSQGEWWYGNYKRECEIQREYNKTLGEQ